MKHGAEGRGGGGTQYTERARGHVLAPQGAPGPLTWAVPSSGAVLWGNGRGMGGASGAQSCAFSPGADPSAQGLSPSTLTLCPGLCPVTALPSL